MINRFAVWQKKFSSKMKIVLQKNTESQKSHHNDKVGKLHFIVKILFYIIIDFYHSLKVLILKPQHI